LVSLVIEEIVSVIPMLLVFEVVDDVVVVVVVVMVVIITDTSYVREQRLWIWVDPVHKWHSYWYYPHDRVLVLLLWDDSDSCRALIYLHFVYLNNGVRIQCESPVASPGGVSIVKRCPIQISRY